MTMMIKANEAECLDGMVCAEIRYQCVANEVAKPKRPATVIKLKSERKSPMPDNPTGRILCAPLKVAVAQ